LDAAIGWISPEAGARRARARVTLEHSRKLLDDLQTRRYEAAARGRRTANWITPSSSSNT
jgi:hypothetical protein